jgi:hypothetical protein
MNEKFLVIKVAQLAVSYPKSEKNRIVGGSLREITIFKKRSLKATSTFSRSLFLSLIFLIASLHSDLTFVSVSVYLSLTELNCDCSFANSSCETPRGVEVCVVLSDLVEGVGLLLRDECIDTWRSLLSSRRFSLPHCSFSRTWRFFSSSSPSENDKNKINDDKI